MCTLDVYKIDLKDQKWQHMSKSISFYTKNISTKLH